MRKLLSILVMLFAILTTGCASQGYVPYARQDVRFAPQIVIVQQPTVYSAQCNRYFYTYAEKSACETAIAVRYSEEVRRIQQQNYRIEHEQRVRENDAKRYSNER